ncbi:hypothetical protein BD779DRAFT_1456089 [Infundibulicybe gibba]|nr:hypothetical protein BD779DRAFT_1456089 [Infundibulicybe gibba]
MPFFGARIVDAHLGRLDIIYIAFGILLPGHIILIRRHWCILGGIDGHATWYVLS